MRIKIKKELDLPQLIEWAINNEITRSINIDNKEKTSNVRFEDGFLVSVNGDIGENDRFTVEVDEKLTESTTLGLIILTFKTDSGKLESYYYENNSIDGVLKQSSHLSFLDKYLTMTYFDENGVPHLIWQDGSIL